MVLNTVKNVNCEFEDLQCEYKQGQQLYLYFYHFKYYDMNEIKRKRTHLSWVASFW